MRIRLQPVYRAVLAVRLEQVDILEPGIRRDHLESGLAPECLQVKHIHTWPQREDGKRPAQRVRGDVDPGL